MFKIVEERLLISGLNTQHKMLALKRNFRKAGCVCVHEKQWMRDNVMAESDMILICTFNLAFLSHEDLNRAEKSLMKHLNYGVFVCGQRAYLSISPHTHVWHRRWQQT